MRHSRAKSCSLLQWDVYIKLEDGADVVVVYWICASLTMKYIRDFCIWLSIL